MQATVGIIGTDGHVSWGFEESWKPLPNSTEDFRPPVPYWDTAQGILRATALSESLAGLRVVASCYTLSVYAAPFIHHDLEETPLSVADVLRSVTSFNGLLRLHLPDACNAADSVRIVSRHAWTPVSAGTLDDSLVRGEPEIVGTEWYDGARAVADGLHIFADNTVIKGGGSLRVWRPPTNLFLSSTWAQVMCNEAIVRFPKVNPRRIFQLDCRARSDTTEKPIGQAEIQKSVILDLAMASTTGIIRSVGLNGSGLSTPVTCIESPLDNGIVWTANEPEPTAATIEVTPFQTYTLTAATPGTRLVTPDIKDVPLLTAQVNPTDGPWSFWVKIRLLHGGLLRGYQYGQLSNALGGTDGGVKMQLWTEVGGLPGAPIEKTQATLATTVAAGPDAPTVSLDASTNTDGYLYLDSGDYWICSTLEQDTLTPTIRPNVEWREGSNLSRTSAYELSFAAHAAWVFATSATGATATTTYPNIAALVE